MSQLRLREVSVDDLDVLYQQQCDPLAQAMAAFPGRDREAFMSHWRTRVLANAEACNRVAELEGEVAGFLCCYRQDDEQLLGYWFGRRYWGRGIATGALQLFLPMLPMRPLVAQVARHNAGSLRVLEKCGFVRAGSAWEPGLGGEPVEMLSLVLD